MKTIGRVEEDRCSCQKEKQNASHLILYCRKYSVEREALRQALPVSSITILHILFSTKKERSFKLVPCQHGNMYKDVVYEGGGKE
jgi:hypothetical protein